jgi:hypothetical protein
MTDESNGGSRHTERRKEVRNVDKPPEPPLPLQEALYWKHVRGWLRRILCGISALWFIVAFSLWLAAGSDSNFAFNQSDQMIALQAMIPPLIIIGLVYLDGIVERLDDRDR